jgi:S1-C subfamily serine protease
MLWSGMASVTIAQAPQISSRTPEEQKTIDLYKRVNRAVVFITTRSYVIDPFAFFDDIKPQEGTGSGTIIDAENRLVVTNLHVVQGALQSGGTVEIMLASGESSKATLVGYDQENDIAVLKFLDKVTGVAAAPFGEIGGSNQEVQNVKNFSCEMKQVRHRVVLVPEVPCCRPAHSRPSRHVPAMYSRGQM